MVGEAIAGLSAIKTALDLARGLKEIDDVARRNAVSIELQEKILAAQSAQFELQERVSDLEREMSRLKSWDLDKQRYKLSDLGDGLLAYTLKEGLENGEPAHNLCAKCYNDGRKSMMQYEMRMPGRCEVLTCHTCGSDLYLEGYPEPDHFRHRTRPGAGR